VEELSFARYHHQASMHHMESNPNQYQHYRKIMSM
jgi:hypothetical protein